VAKSVGVSPVALIRKVYDLSHQFLWNANDAIMLQRYLELQKAGMAPREAIKETERWVANYRLPPQIMKSRAFKQLMARYVNFAPYTYGKYKALSNMATRLAGPAATPAQRLDAAGKIVMLGIFGTVIQPLMTEMAKKATGNENAYVPPGGELGPATAAANAVSRIAGGPQLTAREKDWASTMSSMLTPIPPLELGAEAASGRYNFSGEKIIDPDASTKGKIAQGAEFGSQLYYPAQLGIDLAKPGGGIDVLSRLAGASSPQTSGEPKGSTTKYLRRSAKRRERRDPLEQMLP
jgi:hypothetical protein